MTELEKLQRAKMYLDKLANGINPITDEPVSDEDSINNVRVSRCLFFVSDILRQVIENDGHVGKTGKAKKQSFVITHDALKAFPLSNKPIPVSEITRRINDLINPEICSQLKYKSITTFLVQSGFLTERPTEDGKAIRVPTEQGKMIGISTEERISQAGTHLVTVYNNEAQQFILDNIDAVIEINNTKTTPTAKQADFQGRPWTSTYDETLVDLFQKKVPVSEIAVTLKRTEEGIRARLKKLGLIEKRSDAI